MKKRSSHGIRSALCGLALLATPLLHAQQNVLQPGDPVIASSANSPASEAVANIIDGTQAKYLNFDAGTNAPTGFAVTPSVGATRVTGMSIESANDGPERDPKTVILEGSNDASLTNFNSGNWEFIAGVTNIPLFTARFQKQTFLFQNFKPYTHYRWTSLETQGILTGSANTCCMQVAEVELLGSTLPSDVTQPGDPVIASSANSPASEAVANVIDNTQAKYLNFDAGTNAPTGFIVTPSIGSSLVTGMAIQSANDGPERDPKTITLEGSNDDTITDFNSGNWTFIAGVTNIPLFTARFQVQTFLFDNFIPYKHYRWTSLETQGILTGSANTCCMQVAEVDLLGTGAPKDVTQPGDQVIASSANSPASEAVANIIDNTQAKYLNFDAGTNAPTGFAVTPSIGSSVVTGMTIESANDGPERDPKTVILEGSNDDTITSFNSGTWTFIAGVTNIPLFTARFQVQQFYFANATAYKHYRWTALETQGILTGSANTCCMQVAEVELLAVTQSNPCGQTQFTEQPIDTPALDGTSATFFAKVNGPWTVQWLKNGQPIAGETQLQYSTPPLTADILTNLYSIAIVGCQTSQVARASIFIPSATKSIGVSFIGNGTPDARGANGAPTMMLTNDIVGVQPQAFWNNATNQSGATDGISLPDALKDSDNNDSTVTFQYQTSGVWGAGTGDVEPTQRMLNGLTYANPGTPATYEFDNVPAGSHAVLVYVVSPPLQVQNVTYTLVGAATNTYYARAMDSDEYKAAPGFYRATSTNPATPTIADFIRFDGVQADAAGTLILTVDCTTSGFDRGTGVNGLQLVLNAPNPGAPPSITVEPQPTVALTNGVATLSVTATGTGLTYQWRKNGVVLANGGGVSGASTSTLTISNFSDEDVGVYSVAVFSPAGSVVSQNASLRTSQFNIKEALAGLWKFDETSGTNAANSAAGGVAGNVYGNPTWVTGQISNAFSFDGTSYILVPNYTKATKGISGSAWVNVADGTAADVSIFRNAQGGPLAVNGGTTRVVGQFELELLADPGDGTLKPTAAIGLGPNVARVSGSAAIPTGSWHHLAFSADGAQLRLYVDGQEVAVTGYSGDINPPGIPYISIGGRLSLSDPTDPTTLGPDGTAPDLMTGSIDDLALWDRGLTASEIQSIFQAGNTAKALDTVIETPPVTVTPGHLVIASAGTNITVTYDHGTLQSAASVQGPWTDVTTPSPVTEAIGGSAKFYRTVIR